MIAKAVVSISVLGVTCSGTDVSFPALGGELCALCIGEHPRRCISDTGAANLTCPPQTNPNIELGLDRKGGRSNAKDTILARPDHPEVT